MDFESFMAMPGCTKGEHSTEPPKTAAPPPTSTSTPPPTTSSGGVETYGSSAPVPVASSSSTPQRTKPSTPVPPKEVVELRDDPSFKVEKGMRCRRTACGHVAESEDDRGECRYHPGSPIFHEGAKGYLCCKRRVLDFDDFLTMPGCRVAAHSHLYSTPKAEEGDGEEMIECRVDHYQTPGEVIVSAFAKGADKEKSTVRFEPEKMHFDFYLPSRKRVVKTIELHDEIVPESSSYKVLGTKVEIILKKPSPSSWPLLAKPANGASLPPGYALTFGVSGRTGTVGGKEMVLENATRK